MVFDTAENMEANLDWMIEIPVLYYICREDEQYWYVYYLIFHPFDWSSSPVGFVRKLNSHLYDTEGICFRVDKKSGTKDIATIYHNSILFQANTTRLVYIESQGHGILPPKHLNFKLSGAFKLYRYNYELVTLENITKDQWNEIKKKLCGVNIPHEQGDTLWVRDSMGTRHRRGDMYLRPDRLFKKAEEWRI